MPQVHAPGREAEVDWGQAEVVLGGVATRVHLFVMRASFSGAAFCQASLVETQQAFLELHAQAFEWFGGVFAEIRFDNLTSAVKKVLKGRRRIESDRFVALRSHYLYESQFTTPGIEGAHQKGGVEGEVGRYRRNHLVPVPRLAELAELNQLLLAGCEHDSARRIDGRPGTVGEAWAAERPLLLALPASRSTRARRRHQGSRPTAGDVGVLRRAPTPLTTARRTHGGRPRHHAVVRWPRSRSRRPNTEGSCTATRLGGGWDVRLRCPIAGGRFRRR